MQNQDTTQNELHPRSGARQPAEGDPETGRRRVLKAGLAAAPVIMSVSSRPVLATNCSVSGMLSGILSRPQYACRGLSPGYWGQHPLQWPQPYLCGTCAGGPMVGQHCQHNRYNNDGTGFHHPLVGFAGNMYPDLSMMQVVQLSGRRDRFQLGAHAVAALLNARKFGAEVFGYSEKQILQLWEARAYSDPIGLRRDFEMLNTRG